MTQQNVIKFLKKKKNKMICEECGTSWGSFVDFWRYTLTNKDELNFCSEECYDKGTKNLKSKYD